MVMQGASYLYYNSYCCKRKGQYKNSSCDLWRNSPNKAGFIHLLFTQQIQLQILLNKEQYDRIIECYVSMTVSA